MSNALAVRLQRMNDERLFQRLEYLRIMEKQPPMWTMLLPFIALALAMMGFWS